MAAVVSTLAIAGCSELPLGAAACSNRFDCAANESCEQGTCTPHEPELPQSLDASIPARDAATDASTPPKPDSGDRNPDGSIGGLHDAGTPPDAGCSNPIVLSSGAQFCTITEALDAAVTGDIITIPSGEYTESITIAKAVSLVGSPAGGPTLHGTVSITARDVTVNGVNVQPENGHGFDISGSASISNLTVRGARGAGIAITGPTLPTNLISNVDILDVTSDGISGAGIALVAGASARVNGGNIQNAAQNGVWASGSQVTLEAVSIQSAGLAICATSAASGCGAGVVGLSGASVTLENGASVTGSGASGIYVEASTLNMRAATSSNNGARSREGSGVEVRSPVAVTIQGSQLNNNEGYGVQCRGTSDVDVCSNNTHDNNNRWSNCDTCD